MSNPTLDGSSRRLAVVATTPDDSHMWNLVGVQLELEERGFQVINLGACTPGDLLAETIREHRPALIVVSSINGHGAISMATVLRTLEEYQLKRVAPILIGGILTTDPATAAIAEGQLLDMGCSGVFTGDTAWQEFDSFIARLERARAA